MNAHLPGRKLHDEDMVEFILAINDLSTEHAHTFKQFFTVPYDSFKDYLEWENYHKLLEMEENKAIIDLKK